MQIRLDSKTFLNNNLTDEEVFFLLILSNKCNIDRAKHSLINKGYITQDGNPTNEFRITSSGADKLNLVIADSNTSIPSEDELYTLVDEMRAIFPEGRKRDNNGVPKWAWKGTRRDIFTWLKKWYNRYGTTMLPNGELHTWTPAEIIRATRQYVAKFEPPYERMRILYYFIMKYPKERDSDDNGFVRGVSDLAEMLENPEVQQNTQDWTSTVI